MDFRVLKPGADWTNLVDALPTHLRDIHFTSNYGLVQEQLGNCEAMLAVMSYGGGFIMQPFVKRPIPIRTGMYDLTSPYGFGGPVCSVADRGEWPIAGAMFFKMLADWCVENKVVTEFCRLHPFFIDRQRDMLLATEIGYLKPVVVIDLTEFSEKKLARRVKRGIRKAQGASVVVDVRVDKTARDQFADLYASSMDRKHAGVRLRFGKAFLDAHFDLLGAQLFYASDGVGVRLLMVIGDYFTAYAHLLASNGESRNGGLDEILYSDAARSLKRAGYRRFHLGGGLTDDPHDSLLAFKEGFSNQKILTGTYTRIYRPDDYTLLSDMKRTMEFAALGRESLSSFFPTYRRENA